VKASPEQPAHIAHIMGVPALAKAMAAGAVGGLLGTLAMDVVREAMFAVLGLAQGLSFTIIGDAAAALFSRLGITLTGGAPLGTALYYLIGPLLGASFGVAVHTVHAFHLTSLRRAIWLSILYVEAMSLPMLMAAAITLELSTSATAQWFGISFVLHLVYGLIIGLAVGFAGRFSRA
jgi:hypothetical protein